MSTHITLESFEEIYSKSYKKTLTYIMCNCSNIDDINDIIQDTYIEFYKKIKKKKELILENYQNYIIGIAKKRIKKYYGLLYKTNTLSLWNHINQEDYPIDVKLDFDIEKSIINKLNAEKVWQYVKQKDILTIKIFYLYFYEDMKLKEIAVQLKIKESNVKNILYRAINKIKNEFLLEEGDNID